MAGGTPFSNHKPAQCLLSQICRGRTPHFQSTLSIFTANKTISSIPWVTMIQPCRKPSTGFYCLVFHLNNRVIPHITNRDNPLSTPKTTWNTPNSPIFIGSTTGQTIKIMQSHSRVLHITILCNISIITLQY